MEKLAQQAGGKPPEEVFAGDAARLEELRSVRAELAELNAALAKDSGGNDLGYHITGMSPSDPVDAEVDGWRVDYNRRVAEYEATRARAEATAAGMPADLPILYLGARTPAPLDNGFTGSAACTECHDLAWDVWQKSGHSHAYATLEARGQSLDPECVGCHSTGWLQPGGFWRPADAGVHKEVGCEACHGMGRRHVADEAGGHVVRTIVEAECRSCHDPENSPEFSYAAWLERIRHW
jgi:hypothetical protein